MNGVVGKARERVGDRADFNFGLVRFTELENSLCDALELGFRDAARSSTANDFPVSGSACLCDYFAKATPTLTLRNRAGEAPWPVPMVC